MADELRLEEWDVRMALGDFAGWELRQDIDQLSEEEWHG